MYRFAYTSTIRNVKEKDYSVNQNLQKIQEDF